MLGFSLTPEATERVYEALVCLAKFGESVAIEARGDKVGPQEREETDTISHRRETDMPIAYSHRTELVQDSMCVIRSRCAVVLHQLCFQCHKPRRNRRPLYVPTIQSSTAICLQRSS